MSFAVFHKALSSLDPRMFGSRSYRGAREKPYELHPVAPPNLSDVFPILPLKQYQCWSNWLCALPVLRSASLWWDSVIIHCSKCFAICVAVALFSGSIDKFPYPRPWINLWTEQWYGQVFWLYVWYFRSSEKEGPGIACWYERRTRDRKVASSNSGRSGGRIFFSRDNFVCWLLFKIPRSFCQKCRWQVTPEHVYTLDLTKSEWADHAGV